MEMKQQLELFFLMRKELIEKIGKIIGYENVYVGEPISDNTDVFWSMDGESLHIGMLDKDNKPKDLYATEEYYGYTVSSYCAKGEKLFCGEHEGLMYVMAYDEDGRWSESSIMILDLTKRVDHE